MQAELVVGHAGGVEDSVDAGCGPFGGVGAVEIRGDGVGFRERFREFIAVAADYAVEGWRRSNSAAMEWPMAPAAPKMAMFFKSSPAEAAGLHAITGAFHPGFDQRREFVDAELEADLTGEVAHFVRVFAQVVQVQDFEIGAHDQFIQAAHHHAPFVRGVHAAFGVDGFRDARRGW
jgi:hypothetical protein